MSPTLGSPRGHERTSAFGTMGLGMVHSRRRLSVNAGIQIKLTDTEDTTKLAKALFGTTVERKDYIDKLVEAGRLEPASAAFLRKALDPFHDFNVEVSGMPDEQTADVIVQQVKVTQTYSQPPTLNANWDLHLFTLPELWDHFAKATSSAEQAGWIIAAGTASPSTSPGVQAYYLGLVNGVAVPTGTATTANGSLIANGGTYYSTPFNFSNYLVGQKRLIALAFEAHDTTADLYRQGSVVCYRMPQSIAACSIVQNSSTVVMPNVGIVSRLPPATVSEARLLPDSTEWESRRGAYCVAVMDPDSNHITGGTPGFRIFSRGDLIGGVSNPSTNSACVVAPVALTGNAPPALSAPQNETYKPVPFHTAGAYFFGLNQNSTIQVSVTAIFETMPTPDNAQLVVLAHPSPRYDPVALELYKHAAAELPVGCPVSMNASGDFWDGVLGILEDVAPTVGSLLPIPGASILGKSVGGLAGALRTKKKKPALPERKAAPVAYENTGSKNAVKKKK